VITDLSVAFNFTESAKIVIGANIFDIYPDTNYGPTTAVRD
jgi:iron complex outermembrane receptor protein